MQVNERNRLDSSLKRDESGYNTARETTHTAMLQLLSTSQKMPLRPEFVEIIYEKHPEFIVLVLRTSGSLFGLMTYGTCASEEAPTLKCQFPFPKSLSTPGQGQNIQEV